MFEEQSMPQPASVRLKALLTLRWVAVVGQLTAIAVVQGFLGFDLPVMAMLPLLAASIILNLYLIARPHSARVSEGEFIFYLIFDAVQLTAILYLTGGLQNPFAAMLLIYVTIAASILSKRGAGMVGFVTLACLTFLAFNHDPLPWRDGGLLLDRLYSCGVWAALVIASIFIALYVGSLVRDARQMSLALAATQNALARESRLSAVGSLAAATAHRLATPLNTMTLIAHDLLDDLPVGHKLRADAELLLQQARHCSETLADLGQNAKSVASDQPVARVPLTVLANMAVENSWPKNSAKTIGLQHSYNSSESDPLVSLRPELLHALGNFLHNAALNAKSHATMEIDFDRDHIYISILDDGSGFAAELLPQLGEPYIARKGNYAGLGLGIFIAKTLLQALGGGVQFSNNQDGGAEVTIRIPMESIVAEKLARAA